MKLFAEMNREQLREAAVDALAVLPIGATEQHGPHLPTGTDYFAVETLAREAAATASNQIPVVVTPALPFGRGGLLYSLRTRARFGRPALSALTAASSCEARVPGAGLEPARGCPQRFSSSTPRRTPNPTTAALRYVLIPVGGIAITGGSRSAARADARRRLSATTDP